MSLKQIKHELDKTPLIDTGDGWYEVEEWGWRVRICPGNRYPFDVPIVRFMRPGSDIWEKYHSDSGDIVGIQGMYRYGMSIIAYMNG